MEQNKLIPDVLVRDVLSLVFTIFPETAVTYEIQDDFQFLLILISVDQLKTTVLPSSLKQLVHRIDEIMPKRRGEYTWMLSIRKHGEIIDSHFGGDSNFPDIGI